MRHAILVCLTTLAAAFGSEPSPLRTPILKVTDAVYRLDQNVLEFSFLFLNSPAGAVYVDCEGQPASALAGKALALRFAAPDSLAADTARPQRVGAGQGYRGSRRIFGLGPDALGVAHPADPAKAASLMLQMAVYPERLDGEGSAWVLESGRQVAAKPVPLKRKGKRSPPPKPVKVIRPEE